MRPTVSGLTPAALLPPSELEDRSMHSIVKLMIALGAGALLAGCVVAPVGSPRAYVGVGVIAPAPVVVVHGYYR